MKYRNGVFISKLESKRRVKLFTSFESLNPLLLDINNFDFFSSRQILRNLVSVANGEMQFEYEWCGTRTSFESEKEDTTLRDMIFSEPDMSIKTNQFIQLFKDRVSFMETYDNESDLLSFIQNGCKEILNKPEAFLNSDGFYRITQGDIDTVICLLPDDLKLSEREIISSIAVEDQFIHYSN